MTQTQFELELAAPADFQDGGLELGARTPGSDQSLGSGDLVTDSLWALSNAIDGAQYASGSSTQTWTYSSADSVSTRQLAFICKRIVDMFFAPVILICLLPVLAICAIAVLVTSSRPVFFRHRRIGRGGRDFLVWKFRSMCSNPDQVLDAYLKKHPEKLEEWRQTQKLTNDPRVTSVGRLMRRLSLDELPQLWNVIKGDMSLIGPRPIVEAEAAKYGGAISAYYAVRPGMTGLWQVSGRSDTTYAERVRLDTRYSEEWSPAMDLSILVRTFRVVLTARGAY